ncbi:MULTISPECIES: HPP family protein [unclassified Sphingomonas]|jgi:CBS domain-containing membrane protein|uniref:HPP family protein n=1 Tax=unclassified Sphingomonas TaxID=196159 RepID=UPI00053798C2|nr:MULTISPECIES: HPP family protein [unclassified Sphingomonas]KHA62857.1 membrane protein [Sphingomonas sp. Ant20]MBD8470097.1 HPP family protein [Sphingomonas sp. CFBP 8765]
MPLPRAKAFWAKAFPADRLLGGVGACIGIALTMLVCVALLPASDVPQIVAPLGASAVLVFAVRSSPLAQPWPVIGGNTLSAAIGVAAFQLIPDARLAAGVAVGAAILAMSLLRCLHPPGGAAALTAVIGGPGIHAAGYAFALVPVALNSVVLVLVAGLFYRVTRHPYPHHSALPPAAIAAERRAAGFHPDDIDAALEDMHESFDIARDDLHALLARAELHAQRRQHG